MNPSRKDWLLLALAEADDGSLTPIQLQKSLFLLHQEAGARLGPDKYVFRPYDYGPFAVDVYDDLRELSEQGIVLTEQSASGRWKRYIVTAIGKKAADEVRSRADSVAATYLHNVVAWVKAQPFATLLQSIYKKYPDYAVNSVFRTG